VRDRTFREDDSKIHVGDLPRIVADLRNLAIGVNRQDGRTNIAAALRRTARDWRRPLTALGLTGRVRTDLDHARDPAPVRSTGTGCGELHRSWVRLSGSRCMGTRPLVQEPRARGRASVMSPGSIATQR
jgi:hypothetical protein